MLIQPISYTACVRERERLVESRTHEAIWELYTKYKSIVYWYFFRFSKRTVCVFGCSQAFPAFPFRASLQWSLSRVWMNLCRQSWASLFLGWQVGKKVAPWDTGSQWPPEKVRCLVYGIPINLHLSHWLEVATSPIYPSDLLWWSLGETATTTAIVISGCDQSIVLFAGLGTTCSSGDSANWKRRFFFGSRKPL